ncbi:hypothetical protein OAF59_01025, partial [bacterium]|nr:hypothetical protein [bacterium]
SVTPSSGAVSVIYLAGAPASGVEITASYSYMDTTLSGALSSHASHWLELSVDDTTQSPRERVLSVPFAQVAGFVRGATTNPAIEQLEQYIALNAIDVAEGDRKVGFGLFTFHPLLRPATFSTSFAYPGNLDTTNKGWSMVFSEPEKVRYINGARMDANSTFRYSDGSTSGGVLRTELGNNYIYANPFPSKEVTKITGTGNNYGAQVSITAALLKPNTWERTLEGIPESASQVFVTLKVSNLSASDDCLVEIFSSTKSQVLANNRASELKISPSEITNLKLTLILDGDVVSVDEPVVDGVALRFY